MSNQGAFTDSEHPSIAVCSDELDEMLDVFSVGASTLHEEAALAGQCFDDLHMLCPDAAAFNAVMPTVNTSAENGIFIMMLNRLGIACEQDLAKASGVDLVDCKAVYDSPLFCNPASRNNVIEGLEQRMSERIWATESGMGSGSVGDVLFRWTRRNFCTPYFFIFEALQCNLKCRLVGAVGSLSLNELGALLNADALAILKAAAKGERVI